MSKVSEGGNFRAHIYVGEHRSRRESFWGVYKVREDKGLVNGNRVGREPVLELLPCRLLLINRGIAKGCNQCLCYFAFILACMDRFQKLHARKFSDLSDTRNITPCTLCEGVYSMGNSFTLQRAGTALQKFGEFRRTKIPPQWQDRSLTATRAERSWGENTIICLKEFHSWVKTSVAQARWWLKGEHNFLEWRCSRDLNVSPSISDSASMTWSPDESRRIRLKLNSTQTLKTGFAKYAVNANLFRLGSTNPKKKYQSLDASILFKLF